MHVNLSIPHIVITTILMKTLNDTHISHLTFNIHNYRGGKKKKGVISDQRTSYHYLLLWGRKLFIIKCLCMACNISRKENDAIEIILMKVRTKARSGPN